MKKSTLCILAAAVCLAASVVPVFANNRRPATPVSIVVTLEPKHGKTIPPIEQQDITVSEAGDKRPVTSLTPLPLGQGSTQLMLLIDDSARGTFDTEVNTLKQFINSLPPDVEVAVAYMRNGMACLHVELHSRSRGRGKFRPRFLWTWWRGRQSL